MKPGLEMDMLVAGRVTGVCPAVGEGGLRRYPSYSTSIADAWEVVEKLRSDGFHFAVHRYQGSERWTAQFSRHDLDVETGDAGSDAASAPHAICLAALRAVGAL